MLRFLSERRTWVVGSLAVLALVAGVWWWWVPRATALASRVISERLGVVTDIEETDLSIGGVSLSGVRMSGQRAGLLIRIQEVDAEMSLVRALFQGAAAIRRISARGIDVEVDLRQEGLSESLQAVRQRLARRDNASAPTTDDASPRGAGRTYDVQALTVRVIDHEGSLVSIHGASLRKEANVLRGSFDETLLGDRDADHAYVGSSKLALRRDDGAWTLASLAIDGGNVRSLRNTNERKRPLALRLREAIARLRGVDSSRDAPDASTETEAQSSERLFARLSPDATIAVSDVRIESRTSDDGPIEEIRDFEVAVNGGDNGWYRIEVGGETSNKGTLNVDLSVMPAEARADGSVQLRRISLALIAPFVPELPIYDAEAGTFSTTMELTAHSSDRIVFEGAMEVRELAVSSDRIAAEPVEHINADVRGKGAWLPKERRLEIEQAVIRVNEAQVIVDGELERTPEHYRVDLTARLPPTDCNDVVGAIPKDVLGSLSRFEWSGNWSALTRVSLDSRDLEATELSMRVRNLCQFEQTPRWVRVERFQEPFRHTAIEPDETVFEMRTGPGTDNWVAFADISPFVVPAIISHEDGAFYDHGGFAPWAIRDALVRNLQEGRYVVGASTISMQLAKNLYLHREKTIARKAQEVILTWWLENALTKDEILELYLNVIEYGPGVYGLRHAAAYYFGREPSELSPAESAFLACMLPSPKRYHVSYERRALTRSMKSRMRRLLEHMAKRERIGPEALGYGLAELEDFHFRQEGAPPPPPRLLPPLGAPSEPDPAALDPFEALFISP